MNVMFITYVTAATMRLWPVVHSPRRSVDIHCSMFAQYDQYDAVLTHRQRCKYTPVIRSNVNLFIEVSAFP